MSGEPRDLEPAGRGVSLLAVLAAFGALGLLFLSPYVTRDLDYPLGWGAATYAAKANAVAGTGLALMGTVRSAGSLLLAVLIGATGQNAFTLVAIVPAVLAAVAGLGAAGILRAALGFPPAWVPVVAFLTWAAFVKNGIMSFHFDNLVNTALILPGFAAALAFAAWGRGALAATVLFAAAGLAHWPFHLFAMAVLGLAVVLSAMAPVGHPWAGWPGRLRHAVPLLVAPVVSTGVVALTFLSVSPTGWYGARPQAIGSRLQARLVRRLSEPAYYPALPLMALGAAVSVLHRPAPGRPGGRRLFLALMGTWVALTALAAAATAAGLPTAGDRLLLFLFPVPILSAVALRWAARGLHGRLGPRLGAVAATALVLAVVALFGVPTARWWAERQVAIDAEAVRQSRAAGRYLADAEPGRDALFVLPRPQGPAWHVVQSMLPPEVLVRAYPYFGGVEAFLAGKPSRRIFDRPPPPALSFGPNPRGMGPNPVAVVIGRYAGPGFEGLATEAPERLVAPGVLVLSGPPPVPLAAPPGPVAADVTAANLVIVAAIVVGLLLLAGGGWAIALLPGDPLLRFVVAPGLGVATVALAALGWDRAGLPLGGWAGTVPLVLAAGAGWALAAAVARRAPG